LGRLGTNQKSPGFLSDLASATFEGLVYLPPVSGEFRQQRDELAAHLISEGTSVLVQLLPGEQIPSSEAVFVFDPLDLLISNRLDELEGIPASSTVAWPLIAGATDDQAAWREALRRLSKRGVSCIQATAYDLEPAEKRRLAELRGDSSFDALFHGESPSENAFARLAADHGFESFMPWPGGLKGDLLERNRSIAAHLSLVGELWLRTERRESTAQEFFTAARWVDQTSYDVAGLSREGNLEVPGRFEPATRELVTEFVDSGRTDLCDELMLDYTAAGERIKKGNRSRLWPL
jgi:hypothetical protein